MSSKAKVIPFANDDLKVEELKQIDYSEEEKKNKLSSVGTGGVNYGNFVKKQQENKSYQNFKTNSMTKNIRKPLSRDSSGSGRDRLNGGTGGQDPNISVKSETSVSTKTGGEDYLNDNVIEDVRVGNMLLNQLKISEWISNYFAMSTIGAGIIEYELATTFDDIPVINRVRNSLLWVWMISSFFLIIAIISRYDLLMRWKRSTNQLTKYDNLVNTGWWKLITIEIIISVFTPYPFLKDIEYEEWNSDYNVHAVYQVNHLFLAIAFIRFYLPIRLSLTVSNYLTSRAHRLGVLNGCEVSYFFATKCMMKDRPLTAQCTSMIASIGIGGFLLRVFEQPLRKASEQDFSYSNSFWNVIVTMSTVGYGDFFPKTSMGRFVGVIICLWGVVVVSIFVVTVTNMLAFDPTEEKTYSLLQRLSYKEDLKKQATYVLAAAYKGRSILKKNSKNSRSYIGSIRDFRKNILSFQRTARTVRSFYEGDTDIEILGKSVEGLYDELGNIKTGMETIQEYLTEMRSNNLAPSLRA